MSRNLWLNLSIALVLILIAAFAGRLHKWNWHRAAQQTSHTSRSNEATATDPGSEESDSSKTEILVRFRAGVSAQAIENITSRFNDEVEDHIEAVDGLDVIEDEDNRSADEVAAQYRALAEVEYAETNSEIKLDHEGAGKHLHANDELFFKQWGLFNHGQDGGKSGADISAMQAWAVTKGSDQVVVAVLDSGVDYTHPDLAGNIWTRPEIIKQYEDSDLTSEGPIDDMHGFNVVEDNGDPMDDNGHGTHCAGIIGAEGGNEVGIAGVNWTVKIMPLKFMDSDGAGTTKDAIEAINYVINRKRAGVNVRVISASWGSTTKSRALEDVIRKAGDEGILIVAAAGNDHSDNDAKPHYPASYDLNNVISVAAVNRNDELTTFSNFGATSVDVAAPGEQIISTWLQHGFEEKQGTSMATPFVAGVAALVLSTNPGISIDELRLRLLNSVDAVPSLNGKVATGGRINAAKAVAGG
ncbi:MAG TPA: S8 family peptidase [Pyrinomonadaceae bacterium]|nr:S8 family peptidase [Pyrinomonadaceae bacterium]